MKRPSVSWAPLLFVACVITILPLMALLELPFERQVKGWVGFDYNPPDYCAPVLNRGSFGAWRREGRLPTLLEEARAVRYGEAIYGSERSSRCERRVERRLLDHPAVGCARLTRSTT
jgi:hypothetical protein